jgi:hypothetical protein
MTARPRKTEDQPSEAAAEPLDPEFVARIRESLADPRPSIPAAQVRAEIKALHEARLKRGA